MTQAQSDIVSHSRAKSIDRHNLFSTTHSITIQNYHFITFYKKVMSSKRKSKTSAIQSTGFEEVAKQLDCQVSD